MHRFERVQKMPVKVRLAQTPRSVGSKSFFLDLQGLAAEPVNLFRTTFVDTLSRPRGVEHDGDVGSDSSQVLIRCGDGKTAIFLFKDCRLRLAGDNKILFVPEAITAH